MPKNMFTKGQNQTRQPRKFYSVTTNDVPVDVADQALNQNQNAKTKDGFTRRSFFGGGSKVETLSGDKNKADAPASVIPDNVATTAPRFHRFRQAAIGVVTSLGVIMGGAILQKSSSQTQAAPEPGTPAIQTSSAPPSSALLSPPVPATLSAPSAVATTAAVVPVPAPRPVYALASPTKTPAPTTNINSVAVAAKMPMPVPVPMQRPQMTYKPANNSVNNPANVTIVPLDRPSLQPLHPAQTDQSYLRQIMQAGATHNIHQLIVNAKPVTLYACADAEICKRTDTLPPQARLMVLPPEMGFIPGTNDFWVHVKEARPQGVTGFVRVTGTNMHYAKLNP